MAISAGSLSAQVKKSRRRSGGCWRGDAAAADYGRAMAGVETLKH